MDKDIKALLGSPADTVRVSLTPQLEARLVALGRRRFGTIRKAELLPVAVLTAAAYGVIAWERSLKPKQRQQPKAKSAKASKKETLKK